MAAALRVKTRAREMRHAPMAMNTVMTKGNSSGNSDMPSAMPASIACNQEPRSRPNNRTVVRSGDGADHGEVANEPAQLAL